MQIVEAERLQQEFKGKECKHEHKEKEYYLGTHTGDYVCSQCGKSFTTRD